MLEPLGDVRLRKNRSLGGFDIVGRDINVSSYSEQVDINVDDDNVENVMNLWKRIIPNTYGMRTDIQIIPNQHKTIYVKKQGYEQVEEIYLKNGMVRDSDAFYNMHMSLLEDGRGNWSLLESCLEATIGKTLRLTISYLNCIDDDDEVNKIVEQIRTLII